MIPLMSYEVLARRFRPQTFDDVEGQKHVVTALRNAIKLGRVPHAILLAGPRGVAKTTLARILARALNCDEGPTEKPCGRCSPCLEIAAGTSLDVQEIDAASNTGVDNVREIRESVRYAAAPGKHRIFIIDEVHMLSTAAFNALLKTLEEPPARSLFIFATTDPQKIPQTVLSRVQRFDLRRLSNAELLALLQKICAADAIEAPEPVLRAIAREADGSGRDALTLLDRLTSALGAKIVLADAIAILDVIDRKLLTRRARAGARAPPERRAAGDAPRARAGRRSDALRGRPPGRDPRPGRRAAGRRSHRPDRRRSRRARRAARARARPRRRDVAAPVPGAVDPHAGARARHAPGARARDGGGAARDPARGGDAGGAGVEAGRARERKRRPRAVGAGRTVGRRARSRQPLDAAAGPALGAAERSARRGGASDSAARAGARSRSGARAAQRPDSGLPRPRASASRGAAAARRRRHDPSRPSEEPAPAPAVPALSLDQRNALEARVRAEAKAHPRVREVQEALDAELREIRIERGGVR